MAHGNIRKIGDKYEVTFDFGKNEEGKNIRTNWKNEMSLL